MHLLVKHQIKYREHKREGDRDFSPSQLPYITNWIKDYFFALGYPHDNTAGFQLVHVCIRVTVLSEHLGDAAVLPPACYASLLCLTTYQVYHLVFQCLALLSLP